MICPLLRKCEAKVSIDHYRDVCANMAEDAYKKCDHYRKQAGEMRTPLDWQKLLLPT